LTTIYCDIDIELYKAHTCALCFESSNMFSFTYTIKVESEGLRRKSILKDFHDNDNDERLVLISFTALVLHLVPKQG